MIFLIFIDGNRIEMFETKKLNFFTFRNKEIEMIRLRKGKAQFPIGTICLFLMALLLQLENPLNGMTSSGEVTIFFSHEDAIAERLIDRINREKDYIYICIYDFSHKKIAHALVEARKRGVDVAVIVDSFSAKMRSPLKTLVEANIPVYIWEPHHSRKQKRERSSMHHKFCVFGEGIVWTGSFDFTYEAAEINQEDVVLIKDLELARAYRSRFEFIKMSSTIPWNSFILPHPTKKKRSK